MTKSRIQLISEALAASTSFFSDLGAIYEKYNADGVIFIYHNGVTEPKRGYFDSVGMCDTLDEARSIFNIHSHAITRHDGKYVVGTIMEDASKCISDFKVDLYTMERF